VSDTGFRILQSCLGAAILTAVTGAVFHLPFSEAALCFLGGLQSPISRFRKPKLTAKPSPPAFANFFNSPTQRKVVFCLGVGQSEYPR
jgi:hypothetical protein